MLRTRILPLTSRASLVALLVALASVVPGRPADGAPLAAAYQVAGTFQGVGLGDDLGYSVAGAGDVNGDGYDDVVVGAPSNDAAGGDAGAAYVYFGGPDADAIPDVTLLGVGEGNMFGWSVGRAGDVNGDGYGDVIVGARYNDAHGTDAGQAYVFFGGPSPDAVPDLTLTDSTVGDYFGTSVGTAGDVNDDGYADVVVGAYQCDATGSNAGRAYVYFGGPAPDAAADLVMSGTKAYDYFGTAVGTAGDVNGDGYADVIVGAPGHDAGGTNAGRAYVYFGGASPNPTADLTLTGLAPYDYLGAAVGGAGDVNGDGCADVIVGAYGNDAGGDYAGRAYIYFGGASPNAVADLTLTGAAAGDQLGLSVGSAGDVNGDGYADLVVGAPGSDAGATNAGAAHVYYGGPDADAVADLTFLGTGTEAWLGTSVANAGDTRGDGFADVIVGAPYDDTGGSNAGAAVAYDCNRYFVLSPNGGEDWTVWSMEAVSWLGAEIADVWLSGDGGGTYALIASGVGGDEANDITVFVPFVPSIWARVKVTPSAVSTAGSDSSDADFAIHAGAGVDEATPGAPALRAPWPNPARGAVRLGLDLPRATVVSLGVYDLAGREVARPIAGEWLPAGTVTRQWSPQGLPPGVYSVRAAVGERQLTRRLVWLGGR